MGVLEDFITNSNRALTQEEVFKLFCDAIKSLGYDSVVYSLLTDHVSLNRKAGHGVICNYPSDWMAYYTEKQYIDFDPVIHHAFTTSNSYTWQELLDAGGLPAKSRKILNESKEAKLLDGAAVAIYGPNFEIAGVGLASTAGGVNPDKDSLAVIRALANQFHMAYSELDSQRSLNQSIMPHITKREREILLWCAEGKSITAIATILSISDNAVKFHLKNIYAKLDVSDRLQAVIKAIFLGLINPSNVRHFQNTYQCR